MPVPRVDYPLFEDIGQPTEFKVEIPIGPISVISEFFPFLQFHFLGLRGASNQ